MRSPSRLTLACALLVLLPLVLAGCSGRADERVGALAAAKAYLAAIAEGDLATADAMTSGHGDRAFEQHQGTDVRAALPEVVEPIADPWASVLGPTLEASYGVVEFEVQVSWRVDGLTGGGVISVRLDEGADPGEVGNWKVTAPVLAAGTVRAAQSVDRVRFGGVTVDLERGHATVVGHPGRYRVEVVGEEGTGREVVLGAAEKAPWNNPQ